MFSRARLQSHSMIMLLAMPCACLLLAGCTPAKLDYIEVKRIDEKVTEAEFRQFMKLIKSLPVQKLPKYPSVYAPPPRWNTARTLPVGELVSEERNNISDRWSTKTLAEQMPRNRSLQFLLQRHRMTKEQFIGMANAIGMALSRNSLREQQDIDEILREGESQISKLGLDQEPFSEHSLESQHYILKQAIWINRVDRVKHLQQVPPENIALVRKHYDDLLKIFPPEFTKNPLDDIADLLTEQGMPFEELDESGSDVEIEWHKSQAIIGKDAPDPQQRTGPVNLNLSKALKDRDQNL